MDTVESELEEALQALRRSQPAEALGHVLAAWRARRVPSLGVLLERVGSRLEERPFVADAAKWDEAWRALESARRPGDLPLLLRTLPGPAGTPWRAAVARLELLEAWPDDPRLAAGLVGFLESPPFTSFRSQPFFALAGRLIARAGDARALERVRRLRDAQGGATAHPHVPAVLDEVERALAASGSSALAALSPREEALAREIEAECAAAENLLARIYADPDDDGARREYAEHLAARGDPRGDFIRLQLRRHAGETLSPEEARREQELTKVHGKAWLGPIGPLIDGFARARFERGSVGFGQPLGPAELVARLRGHPAWSTLRELDLRWAPPGLAHPVFRRLRVATGVRDEDLITFATTEAGAALEELEYIVADEGFSEAVKQALAGPEALPRLRRLRLGATGRPAVAKVEALRWLWSTPLGQRLGSISIVAEVYALAAWLQELSVHAPGLASFGIAPEALRVVDLSLELTRGEDGRLSLLEAWLGGGHDGEVIARRWTLESLASALLAVPPEAFTRIRIHGDRAARPEPEQLQRLEEALARFTRLDAPSREEIADRSAWWAARSVERLPDVTLREERSGRRWTVRAPRFALPQEGPPRVSLIWVGPVLLARKEPECGQLRMGNRLRHEEWVVVEPETTLEIDGQPYALEIEDVRDTRELSPLPEVDVRACRLCRRIPEPDVGMHDSTTCGSCAERYLRVVH